MPFLLLVFSPQIAAHFSFILQIFLTERHKQIILLNIDNLQMKQDNRYQRHKTQPPVKKHHQNADIYKVKSQKCRIAADLIYPCCDQFDFIMFGHPDSPAIPHSQDRDNEHSDPDDAQSRSRYSNQSKVIVCSGINTDNFRDNNKD